MRRGLRRILLKLGVATAAFIIALIATENLVRFVVEPVDYLVPELVEDPVLRHRVQAGSGGHDAWGFRNHEVPESAEIVTIGDSQTYGWTASARESWPAWLGRMTEKQVYNLAMGGYGPMEYLHLLETRATRLDPSTVVVGLYLGNDLSDAHHAVYSVDYWRDFRVENPSSEDEFTARAVSRETNTGRTPGTRVRDWLRKHSVLYRMSVMSVGQVLRPLQVRLFAAEDRTTKLTDTRGRLVTVLEPARTATTLDLSDPRIREGLRLTKQAIAEMRGITAARRSELFVVLIPTKVSVFNEYRRDVGITGQIADVERVVANELMVMEEIENWLDGQGIQYVNVLPALRRAVGMGEAIYPRTWNGHPNRKGYRIIGGAVAQRLGRGEGSPGEPNPHASPPIRGPDNASSPTVGIGNR